MQLSEAWIFAIYILISNIVCSNSSDSLDEKIDRKESCNHEGCSCSYYERTLECIQPNKLNRIPRMSMEIMNNVTNM